MHCGGSMYNQTNHVGCHRAMCGAGFMTPPHDLSCRKRLSWIECDTFYWSKRSWSEKTVKNSACFIVLFCGSCRQRKPIQLLNGSNCSNFQTTLLRKIPPLTPEGLNWIPSNTLLGLKIQIHFAIWTNTIQYLQYPLCKALHLNG